MSNWRTGYIVSIVLFVIMVIATMDRVNVTLLITDQDFLLDMGIADRPDLQGLLTSSFVFSFGLSALLFSYIVDKIGPRKSLIFCLLFWTSAILLAGFSKGIMMLT